MLVADWVQVNDYIVHFDPNGAVVKDGGSIPDLTPQQTVGPYSDSNRVVLYWLEEGEDGWYRDEDDSFAIRKMDGEGNVYMFNGWNTKPDGSGRHYIEAGSVYLSREEPELTLYAQWEPVLMLSPQAVESGKKLDLAVAPGLKNAGWTLLSGGEYATLTDKGVLTAKTVTELQSVMYLAETADGNFKGTVVIFPDIVSASILDDAGEDVTGQTLYIPPDTGETLLFAPSYYPDEGDWRLVSWTCSDKAGKIVDYVQLGPEVKVSPKSAGTVTLTLTAGKIKASVKIVVGNFINNVSIKETDAKGNPLFVDWYDRAGNPHPAIRGGAKVTLQAEYDKSQKYTNSELVWELLDSYDGEDWFPIESSPVVSLSKTGVLSTRTVGEAWAFGVRVYPKANPEVSSEVRVLTIVPAVQAVKLFNASQINGIRTGEKLYLKDFLNVEVVPARAVQTLNWTVNSPAVAELGKDDDGLYILGKKPGTVTLTATAVDGSKVKASIKLTVANPTEVEINEPDTHVLEGGEKLSLSVKDKVKVTWTSENPDIATVSSSGVVTAQKIADNLNVNIIATAADGSQDSISLIVNAAAMVPVQTISLSGPAGVLAGDKVTFKAAVTSPKKPTNKKLVWTSYNESVATVSQSGVVTTKPVNERKVVLIGVKAADCAGACAFMRLTVYPRGTNLAIYMDGWGNMVNDTTQTLQIGDEHWLDVDLQPNSGRYTAIEWKSSNAAIAQVTGQRLITGSKTGTATITATAADGSKVKASFKVTVVNPVVGVEITNGNALLPGGQKLTLATRLTYPDSSLKPTGGKLVWSIRPEDAAYASISNAGVLTAKKVTDFHTVRVYVRAADNEYAGAWTNIYLVPATGS